MSAIGDVVTFSRNKAELLIKLGAPTWMLLCIDFILQTHMASGRPLRKAHHVVELFSGSCNMTRAFRRAGFISYGYDIQLNSAANDIISNAGFLVAIRMVLEATQLVWLGVPCSSWVFMSSGSTKRKPQTPTGDETLPSVVAANCIAVRSALLVLLATVMGLHFIIEQPGSSQLINLDVFQNIFRNLGLKVWFQKFPMGCWGHWCIKPTWLLGSPQWITIFRAKMTKQIRQLLKKKAEKYQLFKVSFKKGQRKVTGGRDMKRSGVYPREFCDEVCRQHALFLQSCREKGLDWQVCADPALVTKPSTDLWCHDRLAWQIVLFLKAEASRGRWNPEMFS